MTTEHRKSEAASATIYRDGPALDGLRTAAIGGFRCKSVEAGADLLEDIAAGLRDERFGAVLGPMNGNTWNSYRLITESDGSGPFLMEPTSGPHDHTAFAAAGFAPVARYFSARVAVAEALDNPHEPAPGITIETWDGTNPEGHFASVFALSEKAFAGNAFYTPITREAFLAMYMPLVPMMKRELILMARDGAGGLAGFLFGVPNYQDGPAPASVILKTYASLVPGAGRHLAHAFHRAAAVMGFTTAIHALIHETNASADRSRLLGAEVFRRYALMGRRLG